MVVRWVQPAPCLLCPTALPVAAWICAAMALARAMYWVMVSVDFFSKPASCFFSCSRFAVLVCWYKDSSWFQASIALDASPIVCRCCSSTHMIIRPFAWLLCGSSAECRITILGCQQTPHLDLPGAVVIISQLWESKFVDLRGRHGYFGVR